MTTFTPRVSQRGSGVERRTVDLAPTAFGQRDRRSGRERRSVTDRRSGTFTCIIDRGRKPVTTVWDGVAPPLLRPRTPVDTPAGLSFSPVEVWGLVVQPHGEVLRRSLQLANQLAPKLLRALPNRVLIVLWIARRPIRKQGTAMSLWN